MPLFVLTLLAWQVLGIGHLYHAIAATVLGRIYPLLDPAGAVRGAAVEKGEIVLKLLVDGKRIGLNINADDITSNTAMLIALYAASPIRRRSRRFVLFFAGSLAILHLAHLLTFFTVSQEAFMSYPDIAESLRPSWLRITFIPSVNTFFEQLGMYFIVLVLWFPYIITCLRDTQRSTGAVHASKKAPDPQPHRRSR